MIFTAAFQMEGSPPLLDRSTGALVVPVGRFRPETNQRRYVVVGVAASLRRNGTDAGPKSVVFLSIEGPTTGCDVILGARGGRPTPLPIPLPTEQNAVYLQQGQLYVHPAASLDDAEWHMPVHVLCFGVEFFQKEMETHGGWATVSRRITTGEY